MLKKSLITNLVSGFSSIAILGSIASTGYCQRSTLPDPVVPTGFGVNIHFTDASPIEMQALASGGFGFIRMDFSWQDCEERPGIYDFTHYDHLTSLLDEHKIRPLYILDYQNSNYDNNLSPHTDGGRAAFARFAAAAAAHFKSRGVIWEIWNEPNGGFWAPQPNADDYASLAIVTAQAIHKADPGACVVAPGSSAFPWSYLHTLFQRGLLKYVDAVSVHPYRQSTPETSDADYTRLRQLIAQYTPVGQPQKPIISSEWGYSTSWNNLTPKKQADYLVREWLSNLAYGVNLSIYYDWKNDGLDPKNAEHNFGTVNSDLSPKPAYLAAQELVKSLDGYRFVHRLPCVSSSDWKLLFIRGSKLAEVSWNSDPNAPEELQTPQVTYISSRDPSYENLLRTAEINYTSAVLAPTLGSSADVVVTVRNVEKEPAVIALKVGAEDRNVVVDAGQERHVTFKLPYTPASNESISTIPMSAEWNRQPIAGLPALRNASIKPVDISIAPTLAGLSVTAVNLRPLVFDGYLDFTTSGHTAKVRLAVSPWGSTVTTVRGNPFVGYSMLVTDKNGQLVQDLPFVRFSPYPSFPKAQSDVANLELIAFPNNAPSPPASVQVSTLAPGDPAAVGIEMHYQTSQKWLYTTLHPTQGNAIPTGVIGLEVWVYANNDGVPLRARFNDSTGQTFQPDLGSLNWKGWRSVRIPFTGDMGHWGGANDGVQHGALTWDSLLLVDGTNHQPGSGQITIAYPTYEFKD